MQLLILSENWLTSEYFLLPGVGARENTFACLDRDWETIN